MPKIRIIFIGTPEFAAVNLAALIKDKDIELIAVFTQKDRPAGRGQKVRKSEVKVLAEKHHIEIYQPEKIKESVKLIETLSPDFIIVAAYGQIIPQNILDIPRLGCINVHASLLPKHRGASPINATILQGDKKSGVCIMKMDAGLDTGDILACAEMKLDEGETANTLHNKLAELGASILTKTIKEYSQGKIKAKKQTEKGASYAKRLKKEDGYLDFSQKATNIERRIRAYSPWPGTYAYLNTHLPNERLLFKILAVRGEAIKTTKYLPGELFMYNSALAVKCGNNKALVIIKLQIAGKKAMEADSFLRGNQSIAGMFLE